ncbi:WS/DGAT domain-containing protein [Pseudonocardia sp. 73-21]|uniref:WS/DGAT domain-containing protein n=1 Tax=Pseudonocardia sp. 73-21 TaxID=1895809 RepID=UPI002604E4B1|nr:WS/DGAT domain-containing protein [Pseudonocardia sp. 73-21]
MDHQPMPVQDNLWLVLDRPENLLTITAVLWTAEPVDPVCLRALVQERLVDRFPVFRRRAMTFGRMRRSAVWVDDRCFHLDRHLHVRPMPAPGDQAALQDYVAALRSEPFDPRHPLWSVHLLQGYGGGSAVVQRYHHAMADGIRLTQVALGILDPVDGADRVPAGTGTARHDGEHLTARAAGLARRLGAGIALDLAGTATALLPEAVRPAHLADVAEDIATALVHSAGSVVKILGWSNPETALSGEPDGAKAAAWGEPVALDLLTGIAHATGTTVNDVCLTLVAGAVARYLVERGQEGPTPDLAWMVPVNLEPLDRALPPELGNHFALVLAVLPHGVTDFRERLAEVHRRMVLIRDSWEAQLVWLTQVGIAMSPAPLASAVSDYLAAKAVGVLTNVPGPRGPMALAGARVEGMVGWAPTSGQQAVTVCIFSYAGRVSVGFGTDRAVVPDPERLVAAFDAEVAAATRATLERTPS